MTVYSDSVFDEDKQTRKRTTGYVIYFSGGPTSCSRKHLVVALLSTAAECVKELFYSFPRFLLVALLIRFFPLFSMTTRVP